MNVVRKRFSGSKTRFIAATISGIMLVSACQMATPCTGVIPMRAYAEEVEAVEDLTLNLEDEISPEGASDEAEQKNKQEAPHAKKMLRYDCGTTDFVVHAFVEQGSLPSGSYLVIDSVNDTAAANQAEYRVSDFVVSTSLLNIRFCDEDGEEVEPEGEVTIQLVPKVIQNEDLWTLVKIEKKEDAEVLDSGEISSKQDATIQYTTKSFENGQYAVIYTLSSATENNEEYVYRISGNDKVKLSDILATLHISVDTGDIVSVAQSRTELITVTENNGDYDIVAAKPFTSREALYVNLSDGRALAIPVINAEYVKNLGLVLSEASILDHDTPMSYPASIREGQDYNLSLTFTENARYQFYDDESTMTYAIPEGIDFGFEDFSESFSIELPSGSVLDDNTVDYDAKKNTLRFTFNTSDVDLWHEFQKMNDASFKIVLRAQFDPEVKRIQFSDDVSREITQDATERLNVDYKGVYDPDADRVDYTLVLTAIGNLEDINIWDTLEGAALEYNRDDGVSVEGHRKSELSAYTSAGNLKGFNLNIDRMVDGQQITMKYSANINYDELTGYGTESEVKSTVYVRTDKEYSTVCNLAGQIKYAALSNEMTEPEKNSDGLLEVDWEIHLNDDQKTGAVGSTISDYMVDGVLEAMSYAGAGLEIEINDEKNWVGDVEIPWSEANMKGLSYDADMNYDGAHWSFTIPEYFTLTNGELIDNGAAYSYVIRYSTVIDADTVITNNAKIKTVTKESKSGQEIENVIDLPKADDTLSMTHEMVGWDTDAVTWHAKINRVNKDVSHATLIIDPPHYDGKIDEINEKSITVDGLNANKGERYKVKKLDDGRVAIQFFTGPADMSTGMFAAEDDFEEININYQTANNQEWLENDYNSGQNHSHVSSAVLAANHQMIEKSVAANPKPIRLSQTGEQVGVVIGEDGVVLPLFRCEAIISGVDAHSFDEDGNLMVTVEYDTDLLELFDITKQDAADLDDLSASLDSEQSISAHWDQSLKQNTPNWAGPVAPEIKTYEVKEQPKGIVFNFNTNQDGWGSARTLNENGSFNYGTSYAIVYYLKAKDTDAVKKMAHGAMKAKSDLYDMKVKTTWNTEELETETVLSAYLPMIQQNVSLDKSGRMMNSELVFNPYKIKANNGSKVKMTITDNNVDVDTDSVSVQLDPSANEDAVNWSYHNNVGTYQLPDETTVTVSYNATVVANDEQNVPVEVIGVAGMTYTQDIKE